MNEEATTTSENEPAAGRAVLRRWVIGALVLATVGVYAIGGVPVETLLERATRAAQDAGPWGLVIFGAAYAAAALLFVPGSAMTLGAGALFGPWLGTVVVSLASTTAAALAFLIARHLARGWVEGLASRHRTFGAVDRAVSEGGWRVVGLLRLSPAFPFSAGNYMFGLTGVRFWPYVLASWIGMFPATVLYVWLGHAGRVALEGGSRGTAEWALLGAGIAATAVVTVYLTRHARRVLAAQEHSAGTDTLTPPA